MILELNKILAELETHDDWHFVHIVLTDGEDNASKCKLEEALFVMALIGKTIDASRIKTHFIGVNI